MPTEERIISSDRQLTRLYINQHKAAIGDAAYDWAVDALDRGRWPNVIIDRTVTIIMVKGHQHKPVGYFDGIATRQLRRTLDALAA